MPELPDIQVYIEALRPRVVGQSLERIRLTNPFLVRTVDPPLSAVDHLPILTVTRLGKRIVFRFEHDLFLVLHLMIAGRLHWKPAGCSLSGKINLAAFDFPNGSLILTEAGTKRRASLHLVRGTEALGSLDPGGIDVLSCTLDDFRSALKSENHTLKRSLTDPRIFSGIGNSYSDEILFQARLSPATLTSRLSEEDVRRLHESVRTTMVHWIETLRNSSGAEFPEKVTAFRPDMAVHGRFGLPCPVCESPIQRIRYADNETNYCAVCQTGGKLLSDRAFARLLGSDWPKTLDALELLRAKHRSISD